MLFKVFRKKSFKTLSLVLLAVVAVTLLSTTSVDALPAADSVGPRAHVGGADPANGVYVSPTGNDSTATGSISAPYKSINTALAAAHAGDTIILRGGTYQEGVNVRVRIPNITIKSREGEWAIIDLTTYNSGHNEDSGVYFDVDSSGGKLQSVEVVGGFYAVCMETKWDWGQADRSGASNIIIEDCILHDSRNDTVKVKPNCNNITIRYNEIYNSGRAYSARPDFDTGECNSEGIDNVNGDNMTVQNNYIHDICSNAIYAKGGAADALIENNYIEHAYGAGIMVGFDTSPEYFDLTVNPQYYENIRGIVRNNLIINVGWEGLGLYASQDAQVYNNTIINAVGYGRGLYHSPIYFGVATQDWGNPSGCPPNVNPSIHHNIVIQPSTYNNRMIDIRYATGVYSFGLSALEGKPTMYDNCYYVVGKSATFTDNRPSGILTNAGLSAWQAHISGDSGSLQADPALNANYLPTNPQCANMGFLGFTTPPTPPTPPPPPPTNVAPAISGGQATMSLTEGYGAVSTAVFTITGSPAPTLTQNTTHGGKITLNNNTLRLDIATGLTAGNYSVALTANNAAGTATFSFTLTVTSGGGGGSTPEGTYNIADFYGENGQLSVKKGDIIVVGDKQYKVLANAYTISYWSQNTLNAAISWWTAYLNSYATGGVVEEITSTPPPLPPTPPTPPTPPPPPTQATYNIADFYGGSGQLSVSKGDIIAVGEKQYKVLANTYTISYWSQNTLNAAISWWTAYLDSYAVSGVVEKI